MSIFIFTNTNNNMWHGIDKEWTKEETDYLFELVKEYDLRWQVIADRYDFIGGRPRSMEVRLFVAHIQALFIILISLYLAGYERSVL